MRSLFLAAPFVLLLAGAAPAQQVVIEQRPGVTAKSGGEIRVQVAMGFFVPAPESTGEAAMKAQEQARRVLYESAGRECELLRATLASDCRLESVNVNMNRGYGGQRPEGFNANGNFVYRVTLK
jgi:hypothetical protein